MKKNKLLLLSGLAAIILGCGQMQILNAADSGVIDVDNMGLSKESVFDVPTPKVYKFSESKAGKNELLPVAYPTEPPQIPHAIDKYLPITLEDNGCLDCHDRRKDLGRKWRMGKKVPMPDSHYGSFYKQGGVENVAGARYNCTQCHITLSDAPPLVENTFMK